MSPVVRPPGQATIIMRLSFLVSGISAAAAVFLTERGAAQVSGISAASAQPIDTPVAESNVRYFMRGVGTQDFNALATSPIALYVDDVHLGGTIANSVNFELTSISPTHLRDQRHHRASEPRCLMSTGLA
jgi:hypothetical protein